jgi:cation diffusion facilitator CzcD-associated flavoprotein CzcO
VAEAASSVRIAIVGAGFGGLGTAIRLRANGVSDFVILERGQDIGGTWRDNSYPGCACDVPSHLYSFSFALNPEWTQSFSPQPEIWEYLRWCVTRFDLRPHLRLGHEVSSARWDERAKRWQIATTGGDYSARVLVGAAGPLNEPAIPALPGLDSFAGATFHSAQWNHDIDLAGRRIAVVGTGASAIQFVPEIAPRVARLTLFQRTPAWVIPRRNRPISRLEQSLYRSFPPAQRVARGGNYWVRELFGYAFLHPRAMRLAQRAARRHLYRQVADPRLRAKLAPSYTMGCKRVLISNNFYPALTRDNVDLVTESIQAVEPDAIITSDGRRYPVDTIIFGTGFTVTDPPFAHLVRGRDGRTLTEASNGSLAAFRGTAVAGFPNLFLMLGPNTGLGHNSVVFMIECQIRYLLGALRYMDRHNVAVLEPTPAAQRQYVAAVDEQMAGTVWLRGGCQSWYQDATGRVSTLWPSYTWSYWWSTRRFDPPAYRTEPPTTIDPADPDHEPAGRPRS